MNIIFVKFIDYAFAPTFGYTDCGFGHTNARKPSQSCIENDPKKTTNRRTAF